MILTKWKVSIILFHFKLLVREEEQVTDFFSFISAKKEMKIKREERKFHFLPNLSEDFIQYLYHCVYPVSDKF